MILAFLWKEWREQRTIALAVFAFGVLALVLTAQFVDPTRGGSVWSQAGARELMAQGLAYLAGTVCGAMLLADEKEVGTLEFLDSLPAPRRSLWIGKIVFGLGLAVSQAVALAGIAIAVGCVDERISRFGYATVVVLIGLLAFSWGTFGGAIARSTLGAVFQGSVASCVAGVALAIPFVLLVGARAFGRPFSVPLMTFYAVWVAVGLAASAIVFTAVDRDRRTLAPSGNGLPVPRTQPRLRASGLRALVWLSIRQGAYVLLGSVAAGAVLGALMLAPDALPLFLWPAATLGLGVLAGVTTLGEEQTRGVARFWAERRLPLGRLWLVKVCFHFAVAAAAALVLFVPLGIASPSYPFRTRLLSELRPEYTRFLFLGLVYGFAIGHLAGMLFRKTIVAGLVAGVVAVTFAGLLIPSVVAGGAAGWQIWLPAALLLLTARLMLYPWATDRIAARGPVLRAVGGAGLASLALAAGLAYRVYEIPDAPDRLAESGFEASLPTFEQNEAGHQVRTAVLQFRKAAEQNQATYPAPGSGATPVGPVATAMDPLERVGQQGWGPESAVLGTWLDQVFRSDWVWALDDVVARPAGVFDDPRDRDYFTPADLLHGFREMGFALRARGMQRLLAGDADAYPRLLRGGLAAVRSARNKGGRGAAQVALDVETALLNGLSDWLEGLNGRPDLVRSLLPVLVRHETEIATGGEDAYWAEQLMLRNTLDRVGTWLPDRLARMRPEQTDAARPADAEGELVTFAWSVPWERARRERILRVHTHPDRPLPGRWLSDLHLKSLWRAGRQDQLEGRDVRAQARRRFAVLQLALRVYQLDRRVPAKHLNQLVPDYLPRLPLDPFTGRTFGYRISQGESLDPLLADLAGPLSDHEWAGLQLAAALGHPVGGLNGLGLLARPPQVSTTGIQVVARPMTVPVYWPRALPVRRGDAVLWSAGPDGQDNGGERPMIVGTAPVHGSDWIVVVPTVRLAPK